MGHRFRGVFGAILTLTLATSIAQAQGAKSFGIVAGVDFASMSGSDFDAINPGSKTGFVGGLYVNIPVGSSVSIEPEVLYAMKGANFDDVSAEIANDYIEIPVLVKYSFKPAGGPYLLAGPAVGFSIGCNVNQTSGGSTSNSCSDEGLETTTTFGGVVGIGFMKNRFGLEGRYDFDFGDAFKDLSGKNNAWEILARIMIK